MPRYPAPTYDDAAAALDPRQPDDPFPVQDGYADVTSGATWTTWTLTVTRAGDPQFPARRDLPGEPQFARPQSASTLSASTQVARTQVARTQVARTQVAHPQLAQPRRPERPALAEVDTRALLLPLTPVEGRIVSGRPADRPAGRAEVATLTPPGGVSTRRAARDAERGAAPAPRPRRAQPQPRVPVLLPAAMAVAIGIGLVTAGVRADALDRFGLSAPDNDTVLTQVQTMLDDVAPGH